MASADQPTDRRFSGEPSTFCIGETDAARAQAFPELAILFLKIADHIQLVAVDPTGEHPQQEVKSGEQGRHAAGCIGFSAIAAFGRSQVASLPGSSE